MSELGTAAAFDRFTRTGALNWCAVNQQQIILKAGGLAGEDAQQPFEGVAEVPAAFEVAGLLGQLGEEVSEAFGGDHQEPAVRRDAHDRLSDAQGDDLGVCDSSHRVLAGFGQEIVSRHENGCEQQVEVSVHRGPQGSAVSDSTADFDPAAYFSSKTHRSTAITVESTI